MLLLNDLFGQQGVLLRLHLQVGIIEAGHFPHVQLVCHFLKTIQEVTLQAYSPAAVTGVAAARDYLILLANKHGTSCKRSARHWSNNSAQGIPHFFFFSLYEWFLNQKSFRGGTGGKEYACDEGDPGSILDWEDSPGEGDNHPVQYPCLENSWTEDPGGLRFMGS